METPDKLDEVIRRKLEGLEAEPSARVWVNIRQEMKGHSRKGWFTWSMAAAAALLLFVTGFWYLNQGTAGTAPSMAQQPGSQGLWLAFKKGHDSAPRLKGGSTPDAAPQQVLQAPVQNFAIKREPLQEQPRIEQQKQIEQPLIQNPIVQERPRIPDPIEDAPQQAPVQKEEKLAPEPVENPIASAKGAQSAGGKKKTSSPLKLIAKAGSDLLGLDMTYKEEKKGDEKLMAFHADLGFVKFDRTRVK